MASGIHSLEPLAVLVMFLDKKERCAQVYLCLHRNTLTLKGTDLRAF